MKQPRITKNREETQKLQFRDMLFHFQIFETYDENLETDFSINFSHQLSILSTLHFFWLKFRRTIEQVQGMLLQWYHTRHIV